MMKKVLKLLMLAVLCLPVWGGILDDNTISAGEYAFSLTWRSFDPPLVVDGGGAYEISVRDNGRLIVESTSAPLNMGVSGVYDILLFNTSQLLYLNGVTELIDVGSNVKAVLKGGSINYIRSLKYTNNGTDQNVDLYALPGWSWINENPMLGIEGNWLDGGSPFRIEFINMTSDGYDPVWKNINVITPEPATLCLLGLGGLLIRCKQYKEPLKIRKKARNGSDGIKTIH
jgi:hypothetical protein